ncbi:GNAT family N-acetyltransferase [Pseudochrobactrum kiredjianiae]|uniref:GNAT family N-acetyltransferase n=1 Tax=Pseudochrobactrum kiredjianiae TaxID=386305 RepID=A0ABW3UY52_9HYPH|nr:GNAT family N-acetyltransferase [Pseudochrobactrum kiredjianiae]MDM7852106.1 GNAT family N-acetyltransferase [Pseudochrobactrum kiredjianiae]
MQKLEQKAYPAAQATLAKLSSIHVTITSVLDGSIEGEVWADSHTDPKIVIAINGSSYFLAGNPGISLQTANKIKDIIPDWAYIFAEECWFPHFAKIWGNQFAIPHPRIRMGYVTGNTLPELYLPSTKFEIVPIDQALFSQAPENIELLEEKAEGWVSLNVFFEKAVGFCALYQGKIVSHCLTDSVSGVRCEIGVETDPDFQRMGLGRAVSSATLAECFRRGVQDIEWHSHASNKGSRAIGKAIGLTELDRHIAYSCSLPAENIGDLTSETCLKLALHFEKASQVINWCHFHASGARALAGDRERALENIRLLIESDWEGEAEWLERFWALRTLADDPDFHMLLQRKREMETN